MTRPMFNTNIERAENSLKIQRKRSLFFSDSLVFDSTAWEMLLEMFIATEQSNCTSRQDLYERLSAPNSIISRWIDIFAERDYLESCDKPNLGCFRLTTKARDKCYAYLDAIAEI